MRELPKGQPLILIGAVFILIVIGTAVMISKFGGAYQKELLRAINQPSSQELTLRKKKIVRKITVRKNAEEGCLEVMPDGAVRVYSTCGQDIESALRLTDTKNIAKLFKLVSETNLAAYKNRGPGRLYEVTIETDEGNEKYYLLVDDSTPSPIQDITDTIDDIQEDIPNSTPTPTESVAITTPTDILPSQTDSTPSVTLTQTPTGGVSQSSVPFTCDFTESTSNKRPLNVSNIICSSQPTPAP